MAIHSPKGEEVLNTNAEAPTTPEDHGADEMELVENDDSKASEPLAATRQQDSSALPNSVSGDIHLPATMPNIMESDDERVDDGDFIPETTPELAMQTGMDCFSCEFCSCKAASEACCEAITGWNQLLADCASLRKSCQRV